MIVPHRSYNFYLAGITVFIVVLYLIYRQSSPRISAQPNVFTDGETALSSSFSTTTSSSPSSSLSQTQKQEPRWLLAVMLPPSKILRRQAIRSTWGSRFANPAWEVQFIIGQYEESPWASTIEWEIKTFGDITVMEDFPDNADTANQKKAVHLYDRLSRQAELGGPRYDFISKVDDDNWLSVPRYYETFIEPRLPGGPKHDAGSWTVLGRPFNYGRPFAYTSGRMYTVSWSVAEFLGAKYASNYSYEFEEHHLAEDMVPEGWLYEEQKEHEFVPMEVEQAWDIGLEGTIDKDTILIHCIKTDKRLVQMNTLFNDDGTWNGKLENGLTNVNRSMPEVLDRLGEPKEEELEKLKEGWKKWDSSKPAGGVNGDPRDTLDWKLIMENINIESRQYMGTIFPLNLTAANNESCLDHAPRALGKSTHPGIDGFY